MNDKIDPQVLVLNFGVVETVLSPTASDFILGKRLPSHIDALLLLRAAPFCLVVLRGDDDTSPRARVQLGHDVAPWLVIVYAKGDDAALTSVGEEADRAGGTAGVHGQGQRAIVHAPGATPKHGLFHNVEKRVRIGLVDLYGDGVGHFVWVAWLEGV